MTRGALLAACAEPDILVTNNGGPPPGNFRQWGRDEWIAAVDANMLAPLLLIRDAIEGMVERRFGRIGREDADRDRGSSVEPVILNDHGGSRLAGEAAGRNGPYVAAVQRPVRSDTASMKS